MTYHLAAFATNCVSPESAEVEWALVAQGPDGNWYDWQGQEIIPFRTIPIDVPNEEIPSGWIDHIQSLARKSAREHTEPAFDLTAALGLAQPKAKPILRRL